METVEQVVILSGGKGSRIQPIAAGRPKSLIPVAGEPFINWQFRLIRAGGLRRVLLCVGVGADQIRAHVGMGGRFGVEVRYSQEDPACLLGTGGALMNALPSLDDAFLLMYGDSYLPVDFGAVAADFAASRAAALMTVFRNEDRWDRSNARVAGGQVVFYSKSAKPGEARYIDYGLLAFRRSALDKYLSLPSPFDLSVILRDMVENKLLRAYEVHSRFYEIGKPEGVAELEAVLGSSGPGGSGKIR